MKQKFTFKEAKAKIASLEKELNTLKQEAYKAAKKDAKKIKTHVVAGIAGAIVGFLLSYL